MPPRGFINPSPKTESARSALSSFTCTLCNKSYSRHPEYEAHISSYDHQHRKRLQDLKQLSRDPNAAEKARRAEKKADAEAGLRVIGTGDGAPPTGNGTGAATGGGGGGFKKGGFKSSFASIKGPTAPVKKNVLGDDEDEEMSGNKESADVRATVRPGNEMEAPVDAESDTDEEDAGRYYNPRYPTGCFSGCAGARSVAA